MVCIFYHSTPDKIGHEPPLTDGKVVIVKLAEALVFCPPWVLITSVNGPVV